MTGGARGRRARAAACGVLAVVAGAVYANTLRNGLVIDDVHQIVENAWITAPRHLGEIFTQGVWDFEGRASNYYRPLMYVLYMAVYAVAGRAAWAYHLLNIVLHVAATLLVAVVASRLVARDDAPRAAWVAPPFVAALLFATHPIHTEAVAWAAGVNDLGMTVFGLVAVWCHATASGRGWRDVAAGVAFFLALLMKETAVVIPVIAMAWDVIFVEPGRRTARLARAAVVFGAAAVPYLALRAHALGGLAPAGQGAQLDVGTYVLSVLVLLAGYLEKLLLPINLNFWHVFSPPASLWSVDVLRAVLVLAVAAALAWAAWSNKVVRFAVVLIVVPLLPTFHLGALNQGLANAFAERYLYLPSVGFVLIAATAVDAFSRRSVERTAAATVAVLSVAGVYAVATVARNEVWRDHLTLWSDSVQKSPGSAIAHMGYGSALIYAGRAAEGTAELRKAAAMDPRLVDREVAKATAYAAKGLDGKAILALHTALALDPAYAPAHFNLALLYDSRGDADAARREYENALALKPDYAEAHNNLGIVLAQQGDLDRAAAHFREAVRIRPDDREYRANLARAEGRPRPE